MVAFRKGMSIRFTLRFTPSFIYGDGKTGGGVVSYVAGDYILVKYDRGDCETKTGYEEITR